MVLDRLNSNIFVDIRVYFVGRFWSIPKKMSRRDILEIIIDDPFATIEDQL